MSIVIGIDPGLTGAIARIDTGWALPPIVMDIPTVQVGAAKGAVKREIDASGIADLIRELIDAPRGVSEAPRGIVDVQGIRVVAYIERQQAMPAMRKGSDGSMEVNRGASSLFSIGVSYGMVRGVLGALQIPYTPVLPAVWKRAMKVTKDKESARAMAIAAYPELSKQLGRVKDHNRAEALLLALHGASVERMAGMANPF